jgi:hypothetical protein
MVAELDNENDVTISQMNAFGITKNRLFVISFDISICYSHQIIIRETDEI